MLKANLWMAEEAEEMVQNSSGLNSLFFQSRSHQRCWTMTQGSRVLLLPRVTRGSYQPPNRWKSSSSLWTSLRSVAVKWSRASFHSLVWRLSKFPVLNEAFLRCKGTFWCPQKTPTHNPLHQTCLWLQPYGPGKQHPTWFQYANTVQQWKMRKG